MFYIRRKTIGEAHEAVVREIALHGEYHKTEDNEETLELPEPVTIHVDSPFESPMVSDACMFGQGFLNEYVKKVTEVTLRKDDGTDAVYTYGNRLLDYPFKKMELDSGEIISGWSGNGSRHGAGINQVQLVTEKLRMHPETRRAIMHTWVVELDSVSKEPPCLQTVQFLARSGFVNGVFYLRSNDMLSAWGANAYAFAHLQRNVASAIPAPGGLSWHAGWMETISASPHVYYRRDAEELKRFRRKLGI